MADRVPCAECGKHVTVRKDGLTRVHGPRHRPCLGSHKKVVTDA